MHECVHPERKLIVTSFMPQRNITSTLLFISVCLLINWFLFHYTFSSTRIHRNDNQNDRRRFNISVRTINRVEEMKLFCANVQQRIKNEKKKSNESISYTRRAMRLIRPKFNDQSEQQSLEIAYFYSEWRSSPILSRRLTPCEHQLYMVLLATLDRFFRRYHIRYMMMDGTLLGSYTHHDILPWDDDVDLRMSLGDRSRMRTLIHQEHADIIGLLTTSNQFGEYDKVFFRWSPKAGKQKWSYPFVDIFYYKENSTHIWQLYDARITLSDCSIAKRHVFPLVWRPFGQIWLPAPREPLINFELLNWTSVGEWYYLHDYSHKHERSSTTGRRAVKPYKLFPYYPWVKRNCTDKYCIERLVKIINHTIVTVHTVQFEKYRTKLYFDPKFRNRTCL